MSARLSRKYAALVYGFAIFVIVTIVSMTTAVIWSLHARALDGARQQATRFVTGAQSALNRHVLGVDVLLAGQGDVLGGSASLDNPADVALIRRAIASDVNQSLLVRHLSLLTAEDQVVVSSDLRGNGPPPGLPPGYWREMMAGPISTLVISEPTVSPTSSQRVLYFGRFLKLDGGRRVAVVAEVDVAQIVSILIQGADIPGLEVTLERAAGTLVAYTPPHAADGPATPVPSLGELLDARDSRSPAASTARLSGLPGVVVARPTLHRGMAVTASIPLSFALADWRRERDVLVAMTIACAAVALVVAAFTHRRLRRQWSASAELLRSKAVLDQALGAMEVGFVLLDAQRRLLAWNRRFLEIFPWAQDLTGPHRSFLPIFEIASRYRVDAPGGRGASAAMDLPAAAVEASDLDTGELELNLPGNRIIRASRNRTPDGGLVCIYQDITEKRLYTTEILEGRAQLQATFDALPDMLLEFDLDGRCHRFHASDAPRAALEQDQPVGRLLDELFSEAAARQVRQALDEADVAGWSRGRRFERVLAGEVACFEISASRKLGGSAGQPRFIVILRDTTQTEQATRRIEQLAFYDVLTGLPNRRFLLDRMAHAVDGDASRQGAVLFLDLDHFKMLNDAMGHATGDEFLQEVAARVRGCVGERGTVARLGGDEFVVLLEGLEGDAEEAQGQARAVGEEVIAALGQPYRLASGLSHHGTCSIGIVLFAGDRHSPEDLLKQADIAMYYAKTAGGSALSFFETRMEVAIASRSALEGELRAGIALGQFELYYQSQVTHRGEVVGAEVLVRWNHPTRGLVFPGDFIDVAEETGLIVPLGLWVLETACGQLARWRDNPERAHLHLAVNVSERQFRRDDFVAQVRRVLDATGADPTRLELELTESLLQSRVSETIEQMTLLRALGIRFSMDDFGTGYSSLSYMTQLPLDQVKIDKFFVGGIGRDPKVQLIVQTIIGMAHNLEIDLIAEGVETEEQRRFLEENGCPLCQGYLFGKPIALDRFEAALDAAREAAALSVA